MSKDMVDRIEERLDALGLSASAASRRANLSSDAIRNLQRAKKDGRPLSATSSTIEKLAKALAVSVAWLLGHSDDPTPPQETPVAPLSDVPVMGTAAGSHIGGAFELGGGIIEYVRRPPALMTARDIYALYVEGTSMEPLFRPGGLVFVHPNKPPRIGDAVVAQIRNSQHEPIQATIGYFRARSEKTVTIGKLNPVAEVHLNRANVVAIHKVLEMNELFGV